MILSKAEVCIRASCFLHGNESSTSLFNREVELSLYSQENLASIFGRYKEGNRFPE